MLSVLPSTDSIVKGLETIPNPLVVLSSNLLQTTVHEDAKSSRTAKVPARKRIQIADIQYHPSIVIIVDKLPGADAIYYLRPWTRFILLLADHSTPTAAESLETPAPELIGSAAPGDSPGGEH